MAARWIELIAGSLDEKKRYKQYQARIKALPVPYADVAQAFQRYPMYSGGFVLDGDTALRMIGDMVDLWERATADGTPVRDIVGADPVDFAETFAQSYTGTRWVDKERRRLTQAVDAAE